MCTLDHKRHPRELIAEGLPIMTTGNVTWRQLLVNADQIIKRLQDEGWVIVRKPKEPPKEPEYPPDHPAPGSLGSIPL